MFFFLAQAWAEEGGAMAAEHGAHEAIPTHYLFVEAFNYGFLLLVLALLLRKPLTNYLRGRATEYEQLVRQAEAAKTDAERGKREIEERLTKLQAGAQQALIQAKIEAEELKARLEREARTLSEKLENEARRAAAVEAEKGKAQLQRELLEKALQTSRENFSKNLSSHEQKQLQHEFAEKIQVVGG
jgi:F-type H+-transporting ATPase subunit b